MTLILLLISLAIAQDFDGEFYNYTVSNELVHDQQWYIDAKNYTYVCQATILCVGLDSGTTIKSRKPAWADPLTIYYFDGPVLKSCVLKTCVQPKELTYADL
ncbi:hypothetical protein CMI37_24635 [Candidatus Pacearchaeota archaeon]|nr:hypothetical protein [Candidatus Pacearchaeota archaeon]|tara:strand:+ start:3456 stop:3761 length:306 start_codon:yes stop_codon:yes gene_type:complete